MYIAGMEKGIQYHYNMIKGRVAEAIVQEMLLHSGYEVFHFGMEHTIPGITGKLNHFNDPSSLLIRNTPDFVVKDPETGKVHLLEVKFRRNGTFSRKDLPKSYAYPTAWFIVVSPQAMKCLSFKELEQGISITDNCNNDVSSTKNPFVIQPEVQTEFQGMATRFFQGV